MHILIVNDDSIHAEGIKALEKAAYGVCDRISVVAPAHEHSAQSHAITVRHPILVTEMEDERNLLRVSVEGTPTDCVRLAILELCEEPIDLVISGINHGANMGWEIFFSGTVSAAAEAYSFGIPGVAFSLASWAEHDFSACEKVCETMIRTIVDEVKDPARKDPFLYNVNIPALPLEDIQGVRVTHLEPNVKGDRYEKRQAPDGRDYYWATWGDRQARRDAVVDPEIDVVAIRDGFVSLTKLHYEVSALPKESGLVKHFGDMRFS